MTTPNTTPEETPESAPEETPETASAIMPEQVPETAEETFTLLATSTAGLEAVVARELRDLGYEPKIVSNGRIAFTGTVADILRANVWLRCAERILLQVGRFDARDFDELFDGVSALPWEKWISPECAFPVRGRSVKSQLSSVPACQRSVKKALVDTLRERHGVDELPETGPLCQVEVALLDDVATLTLDTTGPGLHKRGYRTLVGIAPLKETLAAALVQLSVWKPDRPLVDPFCGSGTIPIEAALIGRNIAPGLNRTFAIEAWPAVDASLGAATRAHAKTQIRPNLPQRILASDIDPEQISLARFHAEKAGVTDDIHFQQGDFLALTSKRHYACLIANPPYGERVGDQRDVQKLYRAMPNVFRRLPSWSFFLLTNDADFEQRLGQPATRRRKIYNGSVACTYYQYLGPRPPKPDHLLNDAERAERGLTAESVVPVEAVESPEAATLAEAASPSLSPAPAAPQESPESPAPVEGVVEAAEPAAAISPPKAPRSPKPAPVGQAFGGLTYHADKQAAMFANRLTKNARHLRKWPSRGITCYRLYDRDIPEIPLAVDLYEDRLHIAEYDRPHDRTLAQQADWLDAMVQAASLAMGISPDSAFLKQRRRQRGTDQYNRFANSRSVTDVQEGGLTFRVNLSDYLDTGLFLDHRQTRDMVRNDAEGKRVLNLFAYTGAFTVYAAAGGATSTTTVDLSRTYLDWTAQNLRLNGYAEGPDHQLVRADALTFLHDHAPGAKYDLAIVDPPTFSNSKRLPEDFDVQHDHVELLQRLSPLMSPRGIIYFSTNFRRFRLDDNATKGMIVREISKQTIPPDFRNKRIHRCWRLIKES